MKLCAIETKELEEKILTRFAENQNDELLEDLSDYVINSQKEIERLNNELEEFKEEHKIMKQILIENNLWETLLNDDRFLEYLRK